jgi:hypothetical protein
VRKFQFSRFALPEPFLAVPRASSTIFMFYTPGPVCDGIEAARISFHVPRVSGLIFMYRGRRA